jgi:CBS domain-containing protein
MTKNHIRHLPVVVDGQVLGVISIGDVVKTIMHKQREKIRDLTAKVIHSES